MALNWRNLIKQHLQTRRRRVMAGVGAGFLALVIAGQFVPDMVLTYLVRRGLTDLGLIGVELGTVELSVARGRMIMRQVAATPPAGPVAEIKGLSVRLAWIPLIFQRRLAIEGLELDGLSLQLVRNAAGDYTLRGLPPIHVPASDGGKAGTEADPWTFGVEDLHITNSTLALAEQGAAAAAEALRLDITDFRIKAVRSWDPVSPTAFTLNGTLDQRPLSIDGNAQVFAHDGKLALRLGSDGIDLHKVAHLFGLSLGPAHGLLGRLSGEASVDGALSGSLGFEGKARARLRVDIDAQKPINGRSLQAQSLSLDGEADLGPRGIGFSGRASGEDVKAAWEGPRIDIGRVAIEVREGLIARDQGSPDLRRLDWQGSLEGERMALALPGDMALQLAKLGWTGRMAADLADLKLDSEGKLGLAALAWRQAETSVQIAQANYEGKAGYGGATASLLAKAEVTGLELGQKGQGGDTRIRLGKLTLPRLGLKLDDINSKAPKISAEGEANLADVSADLPGQAASATALALAGTATIVGGESQFDLRLGGERLKAVLDQTWRAEVGDISGNAKGASGGQIDVSQLRLSSAMVSNDKAGVDLAAARSIEASGLSVRPDGGIDAAKLDLQRLQLLQRHSRRQTPGATISGYPWRIDARAVSLAGLKQSAGRDPLIALGSANIEGAKILVTRRRGGLAGLDVIELFSGGTKADAKKEGETRFSIGRIELGGNSEIEFSDRTLDETPSWTAMPVSLRINNLTSQRPSEKADFDLSARIGVYSNLSAKGWVSPFGPRLNLETSAEVRRVDLPPVSPYLLDALGVAVRTGLADVDAKAAIKDDHLSGEARFRFNRLFLEEQKSGASDLAKQTGMPVASILDLLRDSDDNIALRIPVSGSLADPKFDLGDAVAQAIGGAVRSAASTMLRIAFPLLILTDAIADNGEQALKPLDFGAGSDELGPEQRTYLAEIGRMLRERSKLTMEVCGFAVADDWPAIEERRRLQERDEAERGFVGGFRALARVAREKLGKAEPDAEMPPPNEDRLRDLAGSRAEAIRRYLAEVEKVDPGRLFECRPALRLEAKAKPQVQLRF